jgi:AbrB family looped-hinge helix DNA binding protein
MKTTIDKAGRVVIPVAIRKQAMLKAGTELDVVLDDLSVRLIPRTPRPQLVQEAGRWIVRPTAPREQLPKVDLAELIEEERDRWPR